ncbi:hypothetical protein FNV43_RR03947 [Rhamnella rubrinervis]|uniref:START domain-containing protein n=1 Tax=Rhamnella rubrinervis TaxID=2594499 RepID=A0A8K0HIW7_9ROSA|nr:hypothetical protein FNV43_RR03947 [Rhamnella rubrinervis]
MARTKRTMGDFVNSGEGSKTDHGLEVEHIENPMEASARRGESMDLGGQLGLELHRDQQGESILQYNEADARRVQSHQPSPAVDNMNLLDSKTCNNFHRASDLLMVVSANAEIYKIKISELAVHSMEELSQMARKGEPLWFVDTNRNTENLNEVEYMREFGHLNATMMDITRMVEVGELKALPNLDCNINSEPTINESHEYRQTVYPKELGSEPLHYEASRRICYIRMKPLYFVELLMDLEKWSSVFSNIVSSAMILKVMSSPGAVQGNYDGTLQVMTAEFHVPSPFIPTRESYFARYCKQLTYDTWGVVDVSLENLFQHPSVKFRRRPSGCLIRDMQNGLSEVIWVEHVEADNTLVPDIFRPLVTSGLAFSANRWIATVVRQSERFEALMAPRNTVTADDVIIRQAGRSSLLKLSDRMMRSFCGDISACSLNRWRTLSASGADYNLKVIARSSSVDEPGKPPGTTLVFATTLELPVPPMHLFNFLRDENSRTKWDILSHGRAIREQAYINNGDQNPGNRVSIMEVSAAPDKVEILYLQESCTDATGSYVVYAPIDASAMSTVLNGGNPDNVRILPSGFAILPDGLTDHVHAEDTSNGGYGSAGGSLLTIAFHIIDSASTLDNIPPESVDAIFKIMTDTAMTIKCCLISNNI